MKLLAQQRDLQAKIPDIEKSLDIVASLQAKKSSGEVTIARVYNWDVHQKRICQAAAPAKDS